MIRINKNEFLEMFDLCILDKNDKTWSITSKQKSKRKKHYVIENDYQKYLSLKYKKVN